MIIEVDVRRGDRGWPVEEVGAVLEGKTKMVEWVASIIHGNNILEQATSWKYINHLINSHNLRYSSSLYSEANSSPSLGSLSLELSCDNLDKLWSLGP